MDNKELYKSKRNTTKTDLTLLLECLKFQMKCPDLQKQALLTIQSICENREDNVDILRDLGGVNFVYNLSKTNIIHPDVKETALFTLGTLAEANESGQTLAQTTGCLDVLLDLFRSTFPIPSENNFRTVTQVYQLWASVSSALCGCVNNPQNEEGQRVCVAVFPVIKTWFKQVSLPCTEIIQPMCSFISMTVSNNACVQECFSVSGGLETLAQSLVHQASAADTSLLSCQLAVIIAKTLSACITDNSFLASHLAQYRVVYHLFTLLTSSKLEHDDRLSILLCIGQCTEACEEHQSQLVQCGALPVIITLLTEDTIEEVRKAATFILQTCKQATTCFPAHVPTEKYAKNSKPNFEDFRKSARDLLLKIKGLERRQLEEIDEEQEVEELPHPSFGAGQPALPPLFQKVDIKTTQTLKRAQKPKEHEIDFQPVKDLRKKKMVCEAAERNDKVSQKNLRTNDEGDGTCSLCKKDGALMRSHEESPERGREPQITNSQSREPVSPQVQKNRAKIRSADELQDTSEIEKVPADEASILHNRCAGCVTPFEKVTSQNFAFLQKFCRNSCEMHRVLSEATEQFKKDHNRHMFMKQLQDASAERSDANAVKNSAAPSEKSRHNNSELTMTGSSFMRHPSLKMLQGVTLTPLCKRNQKRISSSDSRFAVSITPRLAPLKRQRVPVERDPTSILERRENNSKECFAVEDQSNTPSNITKRKRRDFTSEEIEYLTSGVKKYGFSWNSILWSYPFQPGRSNVDLAKKYMRLMVKNKSKEEVS